jgi:hypothetical protein
VVELEGTNTTPVVLRRACIKIIGCLICLSHHSKGVKFASLGAPNFNASLPAVTTFADVCRSVCVASVSVCACVGVDVCIFVGIFGGFCMPCSCMCVAWYAFDCVGGSIVVLVHESVYLV